MWFMFIAGTVRSMTKVSPALQNTIRAMFVLIGSDPKSVQEWKKAKQFCSPAGCKCMCLLLCLLLHLFVVVFVCCCIYLLLHVFYVADVCLFQMFYVADVFCCSNTVSKLYSFPSSFYKTTLWKKESRKYHPCWPPWRNVSKRRWRWPKGTNGSRNCPVIGWRPTVATHGCMV